MRMQKTYIAIDLKSFYASVECIRRELNPMTTNLVVADESRTEKTICLAVTPALKAYGVPGRARLFEVMEAVKHINALRRQAAPGKAFTGSSYSTPILRTHPEFELTYIVAPPRMADYMTLSTQIYQIYLKYVASSDIHVYSIDEVFIDATHYLNTYGITAHELAKRMILDVLTQTGITATAGIGTNLYLCKVAMDIMAKHIPPDKNGVRIAELDEKSYREQLWCHRPLTDFWRVGRGYARKLEQHGLFTMGDIARCSIQNEDLLYKLFGINAELLIDHAWGWEPVTMALIKAYRPQSSSISSGQVLSCPYTKQQAALIVREMADLLVLDLVEKGLVTDQILLTVGYDIENLTDPNRSQRYQGAVTVDHYGRKIPKQAHGSMNLDGFTASGKAILKAFDTLFEQLADPSLLIRRLYVIANHITGEKQAAQEPVFEQTNLLTDYDAQQELRLRQQKLLDKERRQQEAIVRIKKKYGKNAILRGMNLQQGATAKDRNAQIGGHKA